MKPIVNLPALRPVAAVATLPPQQMASAPRAAARTPAPHLLRHVLNRDTQGRSVSQREAARAYAQLHERCSARCGVAVDLWV